MDKGTWQATVHGVAKKLDMTDYLTHTHTHTHTHTDSKERLVPLRIGHSPHRNRDFLHYSLVS